MAPKIVDENQISVTIPTQPSTLFFPSIRPIWAIRSPEKEGTNSRIPSINFLRISGSALKRLSTVNSVRMNRGMIERRAYRAMAAAWFVSPFVW